MNGGFWIYGMPFVSKWRWFLVTASQRHVHCPEICILSHKGTRVHFNCCTYIYDECNLAPASREQGDEWWETQCVESRNMVNRLCQKCSDLWIDWPRQPSLYIRASIFILDLTTQWDWGGPAYVAEWSRHWIANWFLTLSQPWRVIIY